MEQIQSTVSAVTVGLAKPGYDNEKALIENYKLLWGFGFGKHSTPEIPQ